MIALSLTSFIAHDTVEEQASRLGNGMPQAWPEVIMLCPSTMSQLTASKAVRWIFKVQAGAQMTYC